MKNKKAIMLMSGGVDSSVAAYLLKEEGYEVIAVHFKTVKDEVFSIIPEKKKVCCSPSDTIDAINVSKKLGLDDFLTVDIQKDFKEKIIDYFIEEYNNGKTPNPCMLCNRFFKFGKAFEIAEELNADVVVSGHYVISEYSKKYGEWVIKKGVDDYKDQSYFLSMVRPDYLKKMYFPLGNMKKDEIRKIAENLNLIVANKPDSQELCFIPDNDYKRYLVDAGIKTNKGKVYDLEGNHIGYHTGYTDYTIGQRAGIDYIKNQNERLHVYKINADKNTLIVAPTEKVHYKGLIAKRMNKFVEFDDEFKAVCRIRKRSEEKPALITKLKNDEYKIIFDEPIFAVTPGQFATIYDEDGVVLGSGVIDKYLED